MLEDLNKKLVLLLSKELELIYPKLNFKFHCYLRIAYDNTVNTKWNDIIQRPFINNINSNQLENVISLLESYKVDKELLILHNQKSLNYRNHGFK